MKLQLLLGVMLLCGVLLVEGRRAARGMDIRPTITSSSRNFLFLKCLISIINPLAYLYSKLETQSRTGRRYWGVREGPTSYNEIEINLGDFKGSSGSWAPNVTGSEVAGVGTRVYSTAGNWAPNFTDSGEVDRKAR